MPALSTCQPDLIPKCLKAGWIVIHAYLWFRLVAPDARQNTGYTVSVMPVVVFDN
jgi:hypothetical protein